MVHSKPIENDTVFAGIQNKEIREYLRNIQEMFKELAWGSGDIWLKRELDETVLYKTKCEVRNCYQQLHNLQEDTQVRLWKIRQIASEREDMEVKLWERHQNATSTDTYQSFPYDYSKV